MGFMKFMAEQSARSSAAKAEAHRVKAGKTFRRTGKNLRVARGFEASADRSRARVARHEAKAAEPKMKEVWDGTQWVWVPKS